MGIKKKVNKGRNFVNEGLWLVDADSYGSLKRRIVHSLRIIVLTAKTFSAQKIGFQSVALSFFCTMAVVPLLAVMLAVTDGLGLSGVIHNILLENFPNNPEAVSTLMVFAGNVLEKASSSVWGFISAAFFVWLVIWMMLCVETVFNNVWKVEKARSFSTRFWRDCAILLLSPFLLLMLYGGLVLLTDLIGGIWIKWFIFTIIAILTFSAMYKFIPNTKVHFKNAFKAAIFSGTAFVILQAVYVGSQIFMLRLSGIYGALAAIPFFMFWLNFSWYAILLGAELSYAFQNVHEYKKNYEASK